MGNLGDKTNSEIAKSDFFRNMLMRDPITGEIGGHLDIVDIPFSVENNKGKIDPLSSIEYRVIPSNKENNGTVSKMPSDFLSGEQLPAHMRYMLENKGNTEINPYYL
jgi:hypothetical protein